MTQPGSAGMMCSRTRDEPTSLAMQFAFFRVFPARAGMNRLPLSGRALLAIRCSPHGGDEPDSSSGRGLSMWAFPHARG